MSALTGVPDPATGRIVTGAGPATHWWRAMPFDAAGALFVAATPGAVARNCNGSVGLLASTGAVCIDAAGAIDHYIAGLPMTAAGDLCVEAAAPTRVSQGVGFTAAGRVAIS